MAVLDKVFENVVGRRCSTHNYMQNSVTRFSGMLATVKIHKGREV